MICIARIQELCDYFYIIVNEIGGRLHYIRSFDAKLVAVIEESIRIEFSDLHNGFVFSFCAFDHLVFAFVGIGSKMPYVGNVHNALDIVSRIPEVLFKYILHNIGSQVAYMSIVVDCGTAGVHLYKLRIVRNKFTFFSGCAVIQIHDKHLSWRI